MKKFKLLAISLTFCGLFAIFGGVQQASGQANSGTYKLLKTFTNQTTRWDTVIKYSENWCWMAQLIGTHNSDSVSWFIQQSSGDTVGFKATGVGFCLYPGTDTVTTVTNPFTLSIDDPYGHPGKFTRFVVIPSDTLSGRLSIHLRRK